MFEYFPDNHNWSLAVSLAMAMGGETTEIDCACRPLRSLAGAVMDDATHEAWFDSWTGVAERLDALARDDERAGHSRSAARKWRRVAVYHLTAERMMTNLSPRKLESYDKALAAFRSASAAFDEPIERIEIEHERGSMPALFVAGEGAGPRPCMVFFNGFDVTKEVLFLMGAGELAKRGISVLLCDQPGSGGALRHHGLPTRYDMEVPAGACFEAMAARGDVDETRVAIGGISMGGYFAPRAASVDGRFAPRAASVDGRFAACVAWGAFYDLPGVAANLEVTHAHSTPPFQAPWVFGMEMDQVRLVAPRYSLDPVIGDLSCPLLVLHGESDRQVPVAQARRTHEMAKSSRRRDLVNFSTGQWGEEHCQVDDTTLAIDTIGDWLQDVLR